MATIRKRGLRYQETATTSKRSAATEKQFIAAAFAQDDATAARIQWRQVADQLRPKMPKLAAMMDEAEPDVLAYMAFPKDYRTKLHSTNSLQPIAPISEDSVVKLPAMAS